MIRVCLFLLLTALVIIAPGCANSNTVIDENKAFKNHHWAYVNSVKHDIEIDDANSLYNLYFNLRVTAEYKYANIFIIFKRTEHGKKTIATRYEFKLANPNGEWLGSGSGNLYSYRFALRTRHKFPEKGVYHFEIEQNMRDNPLNGVSDAGLAIEKVK